MDTAEEVEEMVEQEPAAAPHPALSAAEERVYYLGKVILDTCLRIYI
jgi:hypothetical protein